MIGHLRAVVLILAAALALAACGSDTPDNAAALADIRAGNAAEVTVQGTVVALLADGPNGVDGPHQRFTVDIQGVQVEIDHNLDLAPRVPAKAGDTVIIHGQLEPDPSGPVIHYTHHATGRHEGGWIDLAGTRYQ